MLEIYLGISSLILNFLIITYLIVISGYRKDVKKKLSSSYDNFETFEIFLKKKSSKTLVNSVEFYEEYLKQKSTTLKGIFKDYSDYLKEQTERITIYENCFNTIYFLFVASLTFSIALFFVKKVYLSNEYFYSIISISIYLIILCLIYITVRIGRKRICIYKDELEIYIGFFRRSTKIKISDIEQTKYTHRNLIAISKNRVIFKIESTAYNIEALSVLLKNTIVPLDIKEPYNLKVGYSVSYKRKVIFLCICLISTGITGFIFTYIMDTMYEDFWLLFIMYCSIIVVVFIYIFVKLRMKIVIEGKVLIFTPMLGKSRRYALIDVSSVNLRYKSYREGAHPYVSIHFERGEPIYSFPFRVEGMPEFFEIFKNKVYKDKRIK